MEALLVEEGSAQEEQLRCEAQHDDADDGYTDHDDMMIWEVDFVWWDNVDVM